MAKQEWSLDELKYKAEVYCATTEHCCADVMMKLRQWGAEEEQATSILAHLQKQNYINEARYCHAFTHDKLLYQGWGREKIRAGLLAKHLPYQHICDALDSIDETEYFDTLERIIRTKKRSIKANDTQQREKLIRFCLQRGFTYDEIKKSIERGLVD